MAFSAILQRMKWLTRAGISFGGARDLYKVLGYKTELTHDDFMTKYLRQDIASRVINAPVDATWSDPPLLYTDATTRTEWKEWKDFTDSTDAFAHLRKIDIFAGLGVCAALVVGFDDGRDLSQPVNTARQNKVIYLQPYLEGSIEILEYETDTRSPRFGKPVLYQITPGDLYITTKSTLMRAIQRTKFTVHYTRVLHVADNTLEDGVFGVSRLYPVYNVLDDIQKVSGGAAETYWLAANRGIHVDIDKEMDMDKDDEKDLSDEIDEYQHQLRRVIRTRGVKIDNLGSDVADPGGAFYTCLALLSANTGIPQRVLMGAEAGALASQQDRANWAVQIDNRRRLFAQPAILKPFIDMLVTARVLVRPANLTVEWPEPFRMNPLERAQTSAQIARSAVNIARAMQTAQSSKFDLISVEEARRIIAPGSHVPILTGKPSGTLPPSIEEVKPGDFGLLPDQQAQDPAQNMPQTSGNTPSSQGN